MARKPRPKGLELPVLLLHIACISVGHLVNVGLVESKRKSKIPYIWLFPIGLMMADESEGPERGGNSGA
jgi:hypothetical protein